MEEKTKIDCEICGAEIHSVQIHLKEVHTDWTLTRYQEQFPNKPLFSALALAKLAKAKADKAAAAEAAGPITADMATVSLLKPRAGGPMPLHEVFGLGKVKAAMSATGKPIMITTLDGESHKDMIPDVDENYVFELENLKSAVMGCELKFPVYVWGHAGTGKTELLSQICARTNRPMIRVQHTLNTEESHIIGQRVARGGETPFELGPLPLAMKHGWVYLADEYDFGMPSVLAVYQPVLEGKPLVIKEADSDSRVIRPHPNFRFFATGNTNGSGDDTGLYQGTSIQNSANYDRFGMVVQQRYMKPDLEIQVLVNQAGIGKEDAAKLVDFANRVRDAFEGNKISSTISPRTMINAAKLGMCRANYRAGVALSFTNKLSRIDREAVDSIAQRIFG